MKGSLSVRALFGRLSLLLALWPATLAAQPAPTVVSTLRSTSTATTSVKVGCASTGPCTGGVVAGPIDVASVTSAGFIGIASNVPASTVMRLYNNAGTLMWNGSTVAIGGAISGTTGKLGKFTAPNAIGDSICSESGTTLTCVNTLSATTLTGTLSTASQPNVTTMGGLTSASALATVGTITSGVWNGTAIGLARGGTNADLSATGGTSQFLRQNTVGGTVTVIRPAVADLSDASNVALLNAGSINFSAGTLAWGGGSAITSSNSLPLLAGTQAFNSFTNGIRSIVCDGTGVSCFTPTATLVSLTEGGNQYLGANGSRLNIADGGGSSWSVMLGTTVNPSAITGNTNDYSVGDGFFARVSATGAFNLTGIVAPGIGTGQRILWFVNLGSNTITLKNNDGASSAGNRFLCPGNVDYSLTQFKTVLLYYSTTDSRWIVMGGG